MAAWAAELADDVVLDGRERRRRRRGRERRVLRRVLVPDEPGVAQVRGQLRSDAGQVSEDEFFLYSICRFWSPKSIFIYTENHRFINNNLIHLVNTLNMH